MRKIKRNIALKAGENMEKIVLVGGGGHCKVVIDAIILDENYKIIGILDPKLPAGSNVLGVPVLGGDELLRKIKKQGVKNAFISMGSVGDCSARKKLYEKIKKIGFEFPVIEHPRAVVAGDVEIEEGTFIAASATINPGTRIGKNVIINTSASVDHDCVIGDFAHIAPGVVLSGGVKVEKEIHVGTGVKVTQYAAINESCIKKCFGSRNEKLVKAGSLVYTDNRGNTYIAPMQHSKGVGEKDA